MIAVIEMPKNTSYKYEVNKISGHLEIDRVLCRQVPVNYGFFEDTIEPDQDALDVFVLGVESIPPLTKVNVEPLAILRCIDNGVQDDKIIAKIVGDHVGFLDLQIANIISYLENYKAGFKVVSQGDAIEALKAYNQSSSKYFKSVNGVENEQF